MNNDTYIIQRLGHSNFYEVFRQAFTASTFLPLALRPVASWSLAHRAQINENSLCALIAETRHGCSAYLETEQRAIDAARDRTATIRCFAGLCHTAVPIKLGDRLMGFLQTGQVATKPPSATGFNAITSQLTDWGIKIDLKHLKRLRDAYYHSRVVSQTQYAGSIQLLEIFAGQLALSANQMLIDDAEAEPPMIRRAKAYIADHHTDPIGLDDVAGALHVSTFYFCKMFKKAIGVTFTDYLGRVRIEEAKHLLLNPHLRVSEVAYAVGFQSLTHFNRLFRVLTGKSPTDFRDDAKSCIKVITRNGHSRSYLPESHPAIRVVRLAA
jgi:AraC-like DNA-binding protein/ligand-binding sensor protein